MKQIIEHLLGMCSLLIKKRDCWVVQYLNVFGVKQFAYFNQRFDACRINGCNTYKIRELILNSNCKRLQLIIEFLSRVFLPDKSSNTCSTTESLAFEMSSSSRTQRIILIKIPIKIIRADGQQFFTFNFLDH